MRSLAVAGLTLAGLGVPAAAFLAGGGSQQEPGPSVTPAIDMFVVQHEISTGNAPPAAPSSSSPSRLPPVSAVAPTAPTAPASVRAAAALTRVAAALTRVAAASTRVAAAATGVTGAASRGRRPHPVMTPAGAR